MIDSYNKLTLSKYNELKDIDGNDAVEIQGQMIAVLNDMEFDEVMGLKLTEYSKLAQGLSFLSAPPEASKKVPERIVLNGIRYSVLKDASKMTAGQYIDFQTFLRMHSEGKAGVEHIIATVLIPEGGKYGDGYDTMTLAKEIADNMNVCDALAISGFFFLRSQRLMANTATSLWVATRRMRRKTKDKRTKEMLRTAEKDLSALTLLLRSGVGSPWSTESATWYT